MLVEGEVAEAELTGFPNEFSLTKFYGTRFVSQKKVTTVESSVIPSKAIDFTYILLISQILFIIFMF